MYTLYLLINIVYHSLHVNKYKANKINKKYIILALDQRTIDCIPDILVPPAEELHLVFIDKSIEMYNLSDYQRAELLMSLLPSTGDIHPSELIDRLKALMLLHVHARPSILFLWGVLYLPADICGRCVPFATTGTLADVAFVGTCSSCLAQLSSPGCLRLAFLRTRTPSTMTSQCFTQSLKKHQVAQYCYYHQRFRNRVKLHHLCENGLTNNPEIQEH